MVTFRAKLAVFVAMLACALSASAGDAAPNLELRDLQGAQHTLADYHGKPVVLNFWATWCVPCATEMPLLSEMQNRYKDKVVFLAVSVDDEDVKPEIAGFIKKHKGDALTVMTGATLDSLHDFGLAPAMPGTVFIDAEGNIVGRVSGALKRPDLEQRLRKLAGEPEPAPTPKAMTKNGGKSSRNKVGPAAQELPSLAQVNRNSFVRRSRTVSRSLAAFSNSNFLAASRMSASMPAM